MSGTEDKGAYRLEVAIDIPADQAGAVMAALPLHLELSRAEPGCLRFDAAPDPENALRIIVHEDYVDKAAFEVHKASTGASEWFRISAGCPRTLRVLEE